MMAADVGKEGVRTVRGLPKRSFPARGPAAVLAAAALGLIMATPAEGTVREWLMLRAGLDPTALPSAPSVRLAGMGQVDLCIRDEANEINVRDFGGNVAGVLDDSDGWVIESWFGGTQLQSQQSRLDVERSYGQAGAQVIYRSEERAVGLDYNWTYYEEDAIPGDWARVRGPLLSGVVNQRVAGFVVGAIVGQERENEDRHSNDFFAVRHRQSRWVGQLGALRAFGAWKVALGWDFERGEVKGKSVDPSRFHEDTFSWTRPVDRFSLAVVLPKTGGFEGAVRARFLDRSGGEIAEVSWSGTSPRNPSREIYLRENLITFHEEESDADVTARLRLQLGGALLGLEGSVRTWEWEVVEGTNFKGSNRGGRWASDELSLGAGLSLPLLENTLVAAVQVRGTQEDWESREGLVLQEATARYATAGAGLELFVREDLVLRGGVWASSLDRDTDEPLSLSHRRGMAGGFSWLPSGGTMQFHGSLRLIKEDPWDEDAGSLEEIDGTSFLLGMRMLL